MAQSPTDTSSPSGREATRRRIVLASVAVVAFAIVALGAAYASYLAARADYDRRVRPQLLREAGPIQIGAMEADRAPETVLPPADGAANAAESYLIALNSYSLRHNEFLHDRNRNPSADEPQLSPTERAALLTGAAQRDCDFYARGADGKK